MSDMELPKPGSRMEELMNEQIKVLREVRDELTIISRKIAGAPVSVYDALEIVRRAVDQAEPGDRC